MKNLIIILLTSILLLSITLVSNRHRKEVDFIKQHLNTNNQVLGKLNDVIYSAIKKQTYLYPNYELYRLKLDTIRQLIDAEINEYKSSSNRIYKEAATIDDYAIIDLLRDLDTTKIDVPFFKNELLQAQLTTNELHISNFIAGRTRGGTIGYPTIYFLPVHTKNYCCLGDTFEGQYLVSIMKCSYGDKDFEVTVNGEPITLKRFEGKFQLKPTSTGKQTYKVTLEGMNSKAEIEKHEQIFEYWVRK